MTYLSRMTPTKRLSTSRGHGSRQRSDPDIRHAGRSVSTGGAWHLISTPSSRCSQQSRLCRYTDGGTSGSPLRTQEMNFSLVVSVLGPGVYAATGAPSAATASRTYFSDRCADGVAPWIGNDERAVGSKHTAVQCLGDRHGV